MAANHCSIADEEDLLYLNVVGFDTSKQNINVIYNDKLHNFPGKHTVRGRWTEETRTLRVWKYSYINKKNIKLTEEQEAWIMAHELGHCDCNEKGLNSNHKPDNERYAEAYAQQIMSQVVDGKTLQKLISWRRKSFDPASSHYLD